MDGTTFTGSGGCTDPAGTIGRGSSRPCTILLAEDEPDIRYLVTLILEEAGYAVIAVEDGEAAVQEFAERGAEVDFILFDLIMPRKNGWRAFCEIEKMRPGIPHLFMSGFMGNVFQGDQLDEDPDTFVIRKPFTLERLRSRVDLLLRMQRDRRSQGGGA